MPPRFAYWTIIIDNAPTAFRARDRAELMGVFRQLSNRNANVTMKWYSHGKLWESPEEARAAARAQREPRGPDWRPGGRHEDPRARFDKRASKRRREQGTPREEGGSAGAPRAAQPRGQEREPRAPRPGYPNRDSRPENRGAKPGGRERRPWERGRNRNDHKGPRRGGGPRPRFPRASGEPKTTPNDTPGKPEPPVPPRPPSPERPPKPGQEPVPDTPATEDIKILPETPERAAPRQKRR